MIRPQDESGQSIVKFAMTASLLFFLLHPPSVEHPNSPDHATGAGISRLAAPELHVTIVSQLRLDVSSRHDGAAPGQLAAAPTPRTALLALGRAGVAAWPRAVDSPDVRHLQCSHWIRYLAELARMAAPLRTSATAMRAQPARALPGTLAANDGRSGSPGNPVVLHVRVRAGSHVGHLEQDGKAADDADLWHVGRRSFPDQPAP